MSITRVSPLSTAKASTISKVQDLSTFPFPKPRRPLAAELGLPQNHSKILWRTIHTPSPRINPPEPRTPSKQNDLRQIILPETWKGKWAYWKAKRGWELWFIRIGVFFVVCLVVFGLAHIERVPITERPRFNFLSGWVVRWDIATYAARMKKVEASLLPDDHPMTIMVRQVLERLLPSTGLEHLDWKVHVVSAPGKSFLSVKASFDNTCSQLLDIMNAEVSASGKVTIYTGIMPICLDEAGVATVLSHEIGHVVASHIAERDSSLLFFGIAAIPAWPLLPMLYFEIFIAEIAIICFLYLIPIAGAAAWCCRKQESEADYIGLVLMARAGFDLHKAVEFWERMKEETFRKAAETDEKGKAKVRSAPGFLSTHPHVSFFLFLHSLMAGLLGGNG